VSDFNRESYLSQVESERDRLIERVRVADMRVRHAHHRLEELSHTADLRKAIMDVLHETLDKLEALA
jgi:hypothetical protein